MTDTAPLDAEPGWYVDPTRRFELRYHNGRAWTADVSTDGERFVDPHGTTPSSVRPATSEMAGTRPSADVPPTGKNTAATASMVLGIVAIGLGWLPFVVAVAVVAAVLAIAFGIVGRRRAASTGTGGAFATTGLITGSVGLLVCIVGVIFSVALLRAVDRFEQPAANEAMITSCERTGDDVTAAGQLTNESDAEATFTVRVYFVRPGTDNPRRQANVVLRDVGPGETEQFEVTRGVGDDEVDCIIGAVRGPLPFGVDPGN